MVKHHCFYPLDLVVVLPCMLYLSQLFHHSLLTANLVLFQFCIQSLAWVQGYPVSIWSSFTNLWPSMKCILTSTLFTCLQFCPDDNWRFQLNVSKVILRLLTENFIIKTSEHQCASRCWCSPTRHTTFATSVIVYITLCIVLSRQALQQHRSKVVRGVTQNCGNTWWPLWLTVERPPLLHKWG